MNKDRSARRAWDSVPSVWLLTLPHSGKLPPQPASIYPPVGGAHAHEPPADPCERPSRPARPQIGPAGGLSSAIFAEGTNGPGCLHSQGGGPASLRPSFCSELVRVRRARAELAVGLGWEGGGEATVTWH